MLPVPTLLAKPALLIVATAVLLELQVTVLVKSRVVPSLYVPVAVNCCVVPLTIEAFAGVTASDTNTPLLFCLNEKMPISVLEFAPVWLPV